MSEHVAESALSEPESNGVICCPCFSHHALASLRIRLHRQQNNQFTTPRGVPHLLARVFKFRSSDSTWVPGVSRITQHRDGSVGSFLLKYSPFLYLNHIRPKNETWQKANYQPGECEGLVFWGRGRVHNYAWRPPLHQSMCFMGQFHLLWGSRRCWGLMIP